VRGLRPGECAERRSKPRPRRAAGRHRAATAVRRVARSAALAAEEPLADDGVKRGGASFRAHGLFSLPATRTGPSARAPRVGLRPLDATVSGPCASASSPRLGRAAEASSAPSSEDAQPAPTPENAKRSTSLAKKYFPSTRHHHDLPSVRQAFRDDLLNQHRVLLEHHRSKLHALGVGSGSFKSRSSTSCTMIRSDPRRAVMACAAAVRSSSHFVAKISRVM
jgi:hypothetical protein